MAVVLESEDAATTDRTSTRNRRIEVITGRERRRRWTAEQKREIAAESLQPGISPVMVARRYGISSGLLYTWRQQLLCGALGVMAGTKPRFVRVDVVAGPPQPEATTPADPELVPFATPQTSPTAELDGRIEIMLSRVTHKLDLWAGVGQDRWHLPGGVDVAVAIEMDELPACDLPGAVRGDGDQGVAAGVIADRSRIGRGVRETHANFL